MMKDDNNYDLDTFSLDTTELNTNGSSTLGQMNGQMTGKMTHEMIIEEHTTCCLCGTDLQFNHKVDYQSLVVKEDANCPSCMIQMRKRQHILQ
jgi:hypothetical protein